MSVGRLKLRFVALSALLLVVLFSPLASRAAPTRRDTAPPPVGAQAAIVVEYPSGRILYQKAAHARLYQKAAHARLAMASTTKITTAILALEYGKLDETVTVSSRDLTWGTKMGLRSGERLTLRDLLYGLLLPSGNDAALTIARHVGSKLPPSRSSIGNPVATFVGVMNARVARLGLKDSHYANPHGLDARGQFSSAYDLASLTWYATHFDTFNQIVRRPSYQAGDHSLRNLNKMLALYPGAEGVKTGYTGAAGLCLVAAATRDGRRLISVVLNAPRWVEDSTALLDYSFARLAAAPTSNADERLSIARLNLGRLPLPTGAPTTPKK